jgi:hypothetical protein
MEEEEEEGEEEDVNLVDDRYSFQNSDLREKRKTNKM